MQPANSNKINSKDFTLQYIKSNTATDKGIVSLETYKDIPFEVKRVYYLYNNNMLTTRGFHAHKKLEQCLIAVCGGCKVKVDNGFEQEIIELNCTQTMLTIQSTVWRELYDFKKNTVILVLASDYYDESDYIRNYNEFLSYIKNG